MILTKPTKVYEEVQSEDNSLQLQVWSSNEQPEAISLTNESHGFTLTSDGIFVLMKNEEKLKENEFFLCELYAADSENDYDDTTSYFQSKYNLVTEVFIPNWDFEKKEPKKVFVVGEEIWDIGNWDKSNSYPLNPDFKLVRLAIFTEKKKNAKQIRIILLEDKD